MSVGSAVLEVSSGLRVHIESRKRKKALVSGNILMVGLVCQGLRGPPTLRTPVQPPPWQKQAGENPSPLVAPWHLR